VCEPFSVVVAFWPKRAGLRRIDWRVDGTVAFPIRQAARSLRALALDCDMGTIGASTRDAVWKLGWISFNLQHRHCNNNNAMRKRR
jgi:hypothetical protein